MFVDGVKVIGCRREFRLDMHCATRTISNFFKLHYFLNCLNFWVTEAFLSGVKRHLRAIFASSPVFQKKNVSVAVVWRIDTSTDLREPRQTQSLSLSPITHGSSSSSPPSLSPLASSLTRSVFYSALKSQDLVLRQILFSIDLSFSYRTDSTDSRTI